MNKKILVAYFTKGGASREYAQAVADTITKNGCLVELCNLADDIPDITAFNTIILGTGVRMSMVYRRWNKILKQKELRNKHLYLFLSSGMAIEEPEKAVKKFLDPLIQKYDINPISMVSFPGKIPERWAKLDNQKEKMKLDLAKEWAQKIAKERKKINNHSMNLI